MLDEFTFCTRYDEPACNDPDLQNFTVGTRQLSTNNGDRLSLTADNDSPRTVNIVLTSRGVSTRFTHYWTVWRDSLTYVKDFPPTTGLQALRYKLPIM